MNVRFASSGDLFELSECGSEPLFWVGDVWSLTEESRNALGLSIVEHRHFCPTPPTPEHFHEAPCDDYRRVMVSVELIYNQEYLANVSLRARSATSSVTEL